MNFLYCVNLRTENPETTKNVSLVQGTLRLNVNKKYNTSNRNAEKQRMFHAYKMVGGNCFKKNHFYCGYD